LAESLDTPTSLLVLPVLQNAIEGREREGPLALVPGRIAARVPPQHEVGEGRVDDYVAVNAPEGPGMDAHSEPARVLDADVDRSAIVRAIRSALPADIAHATGAPS